MCARSHARLSQIANYIVLGPSQILGPCIYPRVSAKQEFLRELTPLRSTVLNLQQQQPMEVLLKFLYVLAWYCISGGVVVLGWVKAVLHPFWMLLTVLATAMSTPVASASAAAEVPASAAAAVDDSTVGRLLDGDEHNLFFEEPLATLGGGGGGVVYPSTQQQFIRRRIPAIR